MPSTVISGSSNIAILDSRLIASLCSGLFVVDVSPTTYIGSGSNNVLGAKVQIINPNSIEIKPYGSVYEIAPALSGGMATQVTFPIPTIASNFIYGTYTINVQMFDAGGKSWIVSKTVKICAPNPKDKTKNYGSLSAKLKVDCKNGKLFVLIDTTPNYNGKIVESQKYSGTVSYPSASGTTPATITMQSFSLRLYEGVYKLDGETCATYNMGDNVYVDVKYKIKKEHNARCLIDECCILSALSELQARTETDCSDAEKQNTASIILEALSLYELIKLSANCGEDPSDYVASLEKLLGCSCSCNCNEGAPIIGTAPSSNVVIQGCNTSSSVTGLTTTYIINNYEYKVEIAANGGALVASAPTLAGCVMTTPITFNIVAVYDQIKTLAGAANLEGDFWASVVNKALRDVDPKCLGVTADAWRALTLAGKFALLITKHCDCCAPCSFTIGATTVTQSGADVILGWKGNAPIYEIWLDGVLVGTYLQSAIPADAFTHTFAGAANGKEHTWIIKALGLDQKICTTSTGTFGYLGCPQIAAPVINSPLTGACPYNLTTIIALAGYTIEWHTANNTLAGSLLTNPAAVNGGLYYAFYKDANKCYSPSTAVTVICDGTASCTAPQNLSAFKLITTKFIQFQSAAYPPSGNSYTVKRRLASDPDISGSYTNLGNAVWNTTLNRWTVTDTSAADNILYVYKAISNCGATEPSISIAHVWIVCPVLTLYQTTSKIDYSFVPITGATKIEVELYNSTDTVLIDKDTHLPVYPSPVTGTFEYLNSATTYRVRLKIYFTAAEGSPIYTCAFRTVITDGGA